MPTNRWMLRLALLLLGALFPAGGDTMAGEVESANSPYIIHSWSNEEGLPQSSVISVIQTKDGYLWLGTLNGLVRFDGNCFVTFDENNTPGLGSDRIVYLFEDSHTNLWVGTDSAVVALVHDGAIKSFTVGHGGHEGRLVSAGEDADGAVWFYSADASLGRYENGKMDVLDLHIPVPAIARMIAVEKSGPIWISEFEPGQNTWLTAFSPANFHPPALAIDQSKSLRARQLDFILASQRGGTWRLIDGQVQKWNATVLEKNFGPYPWGSSPVTSACEDQNGNLIVGTLGGGIFWFAADGSYQQITKAQGLSSDLVLSLCVDRGGNLWAGTDGEGLNCIKRKIFNVPENLRPLAAQSISTDDHGGLWTAFNAQGVSYWATNSEQIFAVSPHHSTWAVLVDHKQQVWVGTRDEGLFQFQTNRFVPATGAEILGPQIFALFEDRNGWLWNGTQNGLASRNGGIGNCSRRVMVFRKEISAPLPKIRKVIFGSAPRSLA